MKSLRFVAFLGCVALAQACGGDDGGAVDRSKPLSSLSAGEAKTLCEDVNAAMDLAAVQKSVCYVAALLGSAFDPTKDCETLAQECAADPASEFAAGCDANLKDVAALPECAAMVTVGEYESCVVKIAGEFERVAETISCTADLPDIDLFPAGCEVVETKCPELVVGSEPPAGAASSLR